MKPGHLGVSIRQSLNYLWQIYGDLTFECFLSVEILFPESFYLKLTNEDDVISPKDDCSNNDRKPSLVCWTTSGIKYTFAINVASGTRYRWRNGGQSFGSQRILVIGPIVVFITCIGCAVFCILYRLVMGPNAVFINLYPVVIGVTSGMQWGGGECLSNIFLVTDLRRANKEMELISRLLLRWCKDGKN
jgi:hypothetical protein